MDIPKAGLRQRIFAWALARFNTRYELFASTYKQQLFTDLTGHILEIGPGTGANLRYLDPAKVRWMGVEPNPFMQSYLHEEANRLGIPIEIRMSTGETLPVADESVDAVISTLVLCCVNSQQCALQEVLRVLKPGGRLLFITRGSAAGQLVAASAESVNPSLEAAGRWLPSQPRNLCGSRPCWIREGRL